MKHFSNNGKEYLKKYDTPIQGKSNKQYEYSAKVVFYSMLIGVIVILISAIIN